MAKLELFLLGRPQVYVDGQAVNGFNTRKDQALLAYLAATGSTHSRETLAGLLWSELPEEKARRNLRHALSHLQKVIGPDWLTTEHGVALTQDQPWSVDVQLLRSALTLLARRPAERQTVDSLARVLSLYRGEFLQGFHVQEAVHFEEWLLAQREELRLLSLHGLETLGEHCLAQGAYAPGLTATHRLLQLEPWLESAHCLQMKLLAQSGRCADALAQYEKCCQILAAELDVAPLPETTLLYQQIQAGNYTPVAARRHPAPSIAAAPVLLLPNGVIAGKPAVPTNLLTPLAGFVGRQAELVFISRRLAAADCRLLTIVGPGGMGKTSLAQAAAQQILQANPADFPDGIYFVSLLDIGAADERQPAQPRADEPAVGEAILRVIAAQIGYKLEPGVAPAVQLQAYLRSQRLLLILDNFEHLVAGTAAVIALLTQAPHLKALLTSRARLNVRGESVLTLHPLSLPPAPSPADVAAAYIDPTHTIQAATWQASEAIAMFVQRAQQVDPTFVINAETIGPVGQICQLVGGLPLGIELATSMLPLLSCRALAAALAKSLDILAAETRDLPPAQRTLTAVFEHSWRLLPSEGQQLLAKLALFPGSFSRAATAHIAGATDSLLRRLLDQSLLSKVGDDRYLMHRTVHAFAQQKLQQWPEQRATLQVHYAHYYLELLACLEEEQNEAAYESATAQIQIELDNVRTAWSWSVDQGNLALLALSVGSLQDFYQMAGIYQEALRLLEAALPVVRQAVALAPTAPQAPRLLARLLCYTAQFYRLCAESSELRKAEAWTKEALDLGCRLAEPALQALAYHELARQAQAHYDSATMCLLAEQACTHAYQANLPQLIAESENDWGIALSLATHPLAGIQHFHTALAWLRQRPNRMLEVRIVSNLALFYLAGHEYQATYDCLQQRTLQSLFEDWIHCGDLLMVFGAYDEAQAEYAQGLVFAQTRHAPYWESWLHASMGRLHRLRGEPAAAQTACRLALQMAQSAGNHFIIQWTLILLGHTLADLGDQEAAASYYQEAITRHNGMSWFSCPTDAHAGLAALRLAQNDVRRAVTQVDAALFALAQHGLAAAREPFLVYWTCVRVLKAAGDPRAQTVLTTAYEMLQKVAQQLVDPRLRRSFLANVVVNRQIMDAAQAAGLGPVPIIENLG